MSTIGYQRPGDLSVDWEYRIDWENIRQMRVRKLREQMRQRGFDAILALRLENLRYILGFRAVYALFTSFVRNAALLPLEGEPIAFITGFDAARARGTMPWLTRVVNLMSLEDPAAGRYAATAIFKPIFEELGLSKGVIGMDGALLHFLQGLREAMPKATFTSASEAFSEARAIKEGDEIKAMRWSSLVADVAMQRAIEFIRVGVRECEVAGMVTETMLSMGAEATTSTPVVSSGEHTGSLFCRFCTDKVIDYGDFVLMDLGAYCNGYYSDFTRTTVVGKPNPMQKRIFNTVAGALRAAESVIKPGGKNWEVWQAASEVMLQSGLTELPGVTSTAHTPGFITGHGIGTYLHEPPIVGSREYGETTLRAGMIFSLEPSLHVPRVGGVRIEDTVLVTETGCEVLNKTPWGEELYA